MPQNPSIVATISGTGTSYIFDRTKHPLQPTGIFKPDMTLSHHTQDGFGLSFNPIIEGRLLTGSDDATVALWDLKSFSKNEPTLSPENVYRIHNSGVNDVQWHPNHKDIFGSVSEDFSLCITDTRIPSLVSVKVENAHEQAVNCLAISPANPNLIATGGADSMIALWDIRKPQTSLHQMLDHQKYVVSLQWSPFDETVLASSGSDSNVLIYDISRIGQEQSSEEKNQGPPELLFIHGGHETAVGEVSWNPASPWMLASVSDDNHLHVWRPSSTIVDRTS